MSSNTEYAASIEAKQITQHPRANRDPCIRHTTNITATSALGLPETSPTRPGASASPTPRPPPEPPPVAGQNPTLTPGLVPWIHPRSKGWSRQTNLTSYFCFPYTLHKTPTEKHTANDMLTSRNKTTTRPSMPLQRKHIRIDSGACPLVV